MLVTTVQEVLQRHGYASTEDDIAERLDTLLSTDTRPDVVIDMSAAEAGFLSRYGGVEAASPKKLAELAARSGARLTAEVTQSFTRPQIARLLQVAPSRISHQVSAGKLYTYLGPGRRPLFPDWQLSHELAPDETEHRTRVLPQLGDVLARLPRGSHPTTVRAFMTTPTSSLTSAAAAELSPCQWLESGGDALVVAELAATLGEQV